MRALLCSLLLLTALLAACSTEIDTGRGPCSGLTTGLAAASAEDMGTAVCTPLCAAEKREYTGWLCSEADTFLCACE